MHIRPYHPSSFGWSNDQQEKVAQSLVLLLLTSIRSGPSPRSRWTAACIAAPTETTVHLSRAVCGQFALPTLLLYLALSALSICALFIVVSRGAFACQLIRRAAPTCREFKTHPMTLPSPTVPGNVWRTLLSNIHVRRVRFTTSKFATHFNPSTKV
jgi:hypothetical protein